MSMLIDLAEGQGCTFCGERDARNTRVRRQAGDGPVDELSVPLCVRHRAPLEAAGATGRLHKPTGVRWWVVAALTGDPAAALCPAAAFVKSP